MAEHRNARAAAAPVPAAHTVQAAAAALNRAADNSWTPGPGLPDHERAFLTALHDAARRAGTSLHALGDERVLQLGYAKAWDLSDGLLPVNIVKKLRRTDQDRRERPVGDLAARIVGLAELHLLGHHEARGRAQ